MLGRCDRVAMRRVHHHDTARRRRRDIDIVDPDPGPANNLQIVGSGENIPGHLGGRPDGQPVIIADDGGKFGRIEAGLHIDFDPTGLENIHSPRAKLVADKNLWHSIVPPDAARHLQIWVVVRLRPAGGARGQPHTPSRSRATTARYPPDRRSGRPRSAAPSARHDRR